MAQTTPAGKVVALEGTATVTRVDLPDPQPLAFKDDVFLNDRVATGDRSITRLLMGGKASVTVREHSLLHITEFPGTSTVNLSYGRISVAVSKDKMKPGETVEIRTPNSVAAIRGTVVVAEVEPGYDGKSTITVLRGLIDVVKIDNATGRIEGAPVPVAALQSVTVIGAAPVPSAAAIKQKTAQQLTTDFQVIPKTVPKGSMAPVIEAQFAQAKVDAAAVAPAVNTAPATTAKDKTKDKDKHKATDNDKDTTKDHAKDNAQDKTVDHGKGSAKADHGNDAKGTTTDHAKGNAQDKATDHAKDDGKDTTKDSVKDSAQDKTTDHDKNNSKNVLRHVNGRGRSNTDSVNDGGDPGAWAAGGLSNSGGNGVAKGAGDSGSGSSGGGNTAGGGSSGGGAAVVNVVAGASSGGGASVSGSGAAVGNAAVDSSGSSGAAAVAGSSGGGAAVVTAVVGSSGAAGGGASVAAGNSVAGSGSGGGKVASVSAPVAVPALAVGNGLKHGHGKLK